MLVNSVLFPGLIALLDCTAIVLALIFWRRCPRACTLLVAGALLHLIATVARAIVFEIGVGANFDVLGPVISGLGLLSLVGYGLVLASVFLDRRQPPGFPEHLRQRRFDDDDEWGAPPRQTPSVPKEGTGIEEHG